MEVLQSEVKQENWDEWNRLKVEQECAACGGLLDVRTVPERKSLVFGCPLHPDAGYRQRTSYTQDYRRNVGVPLVIENKIEKKLYNEKDFERGVQLLAHRFPDAIKDIAGAALFINDCMRLRLDPLIQPPEAVPVVFEVTDKKTGKKKSIVVMLITEDGYLSMAARGCPQEYDGAPATMPLLDYLMRENPQRSMAELKERAAETASQLCNDATAWIWVALGKRRSASTTNMAYGWYTKKEQQEDAKLPAGKMPGNQARIRAVKRWVRETFPECRERMLEYTEALATRTAGLLEAQKIIDAEYRVLDIPTPTSISPPGGDTGQTKTAKTARTKGTKRADNKVGESAQRVTDQQPGRGGDKSKATPSGADEHTLVSATTSTEMDATSREAAAAERVGFISDIPWVMETMKAIKWSEGTARSWIKSQFPEVQDDPDFKIVLGRLSLEQAKTFVKELRNQSEKVQPNLFK